MEKLREQRLLPEQADFRKYKQVWLNMFTGLLQPFEDMLYLPGGQALRMLAVPNPMGGLMMTFEDVTSRLELESSYNTLIAVQKETLDNLAEGVAVFGGDGRLRLWNPAFARLWALNPEDIDGNPHITRLSEKMKSHFRAEHWPRAQKALVTQSIDRSLQGGRLERADGSLVSWSTVPLPDGGMLVTHVDVTDTVRVETALRDKNAALEAAERLKLDFLANVSYQLRTPLSAIMGFTEILSNQYFGPLNERQREYTSGMQEAGERLLSLIDDILDLSTIEAGYMFLTREEISVQAVVESISNLTREWARKDKLDVRIDCPDDVGSVLADERRLKQALLNLISNAINFSPPGGTIILTARRTGENVMLSVADQGPGIASEDQKRIFLPFERAARADRNTAPAAGNAGRGAGLGLALVKNIVELHGGRIVLESRLGQGATFTVVLPLEEKLQQKQPTTLRIVK
jgi:signal transduction histidine kinase